ncbi:uncharacterized protein LOC110058996 [Orbicella faveolata]|uniref:uncharacterized protein LOC110058996 n=1 Tax=Orbicella faveolata TaxID=48498 RepID=UPI0009E20532|nr:uncharacterized protein LOC110058996 [Orbicella faveolata]
MVSAHCTRPRRIFKMANSALRLIFQRSSLLIFSGSSTNSLIPSRSRETYVSLKRQLSSFLNSNSLVEASCHRSISSTTSLVLGKVIQGDIGRPTSCDKDLGFRSYSSFEHGYSQNLGTDKAEKGSEMADIEASGATVPNDTWTVESLELHKKLTSDLIEHGNGDWSKHKNLLYNGERRLFTKAMVTEYPGKFFEYEFFFSKKEKRLKGVIQFGPYTQGPPGCVHGGASASMMDAAIGVLVNRTSSFCEHVSKASEAEFTCYTSVVCIVENCSKRKRFAARSERIALRKIVRMTFGGIESSHAFAAAVIDHHQIIDRIDQVLRLADCSEKGQDQIVR